MWLILPWTWILHVQSCVTEWFQSGKSLLLNCHFSMDTLSFFRILCWAALGFAFLQTLSKYRFIWWHSWNSVSQHIAMSYSFCSSQLFPHFWQILKLSTLILELLLYKFASSVCLSIFAIIWNWNLQHLHLLGLFIGHCKLTCQRVQKSYQFCIVLCDCMTVSNIDLSTKTVSHLSCLAELMSLKI